MDTPPAREELLQRIRVLLRGDAQSVADAFMLIDFLGLRYSGALDATTLVKRSGTDRYSGTSWPRPKRANSFQSAGLTDCHAQKSD